MANSHFLEDGQAQQDEWLEQVSGSIGVKEHSSIGGELESTQSRLDNVMKKLAKVSHMTSDRRQWCAIAVLFAVLLVVLILFLVL